MAQRHFDKRPRCMVKVDNPKYPIHTDKPVKDCGRLLPCAKHPEKVVAVGGKS